MSRTTRNIPCRWLRRPAHRRALIARDSELPIRFRAVPPTDWSDIPVAARKEVKHNPDSGFNH